MLAASAVTLMAIAEKTFTRYVLLIPVLICFYVTLILFTIDYDRMMIKQWKIKENKNVDAAYLEFVRKYYEDKKRE